jgi:uncharacterized protein (TIGR00661 family)
MKILYAIQGTGNGHLSRAMEIIPCLQKVGQVDILISGIQGDLILPFPITYTFRGLSFIFGKSGGVNLWQTIIKADPRLLRKAINSLPVENYDLVLNDFEPISAWACYLKNKPCIALSHQAAVLSSFAPKADQQDMVGKLILNNYAPATTKYGFHFASYDKNIFTPVIRKETREQEVANKGHYTVYLPSYDDDRLVKRLSAFKDVSWEVFSKHNTKSKRVKNINLQPVNVEKFTKSMAFSAGVLCGAGFETPAEALHLGKKLMVIPMKNQHEQHLNAAALQHMGVPVIKSLKAKFEPLVTEWLEHGKIIPVHYPDRSQDIINTIISRHKFNSAEEWS